jgi:hypothetical protein
MLLTRLGSRKSAFTALSKNDTNMALGSVLFEKRTKRVSLAYLYYVELLLFFLKKEPKTLALRGLVGETRQRIRMLAKGQHLLKYGFSTVSGSSKLKRYSKLYSGLGFIVQGDNPTIIHFN